MHRNGMIEKPEAVTENSRRRVLKAIGAAGVAGLAGCAGGGGDGDGGSPQSTPSGDESPSSDGSGNKLEPVKAAWVFNGPIEDQGWVASHDKARKTLEDQYDWIETSYTEDVAPADSRPVFEDYAEDNHLVFGTTFEYQSILLEVSKNYPDTAFEMLSGAVTGENMGLGFWAVYEGSYLMGVAGGMLTETDKLGFVTSFPAALNIRIANALALGARSVNENATVEVSYINAWYDPGKARQGAQSLIDGGADVLHHATNSPAVIRTAAENDVWGAAMYQSMSQFGGDNYVSGVLPLWAPYEARQAEQVHERRWEPEFIWSGFADPQMVVLDDWGPEVPSDVRDEATSQREQLANEELDIWKGTKFEGESEDFLFSNMGSYVEGVAGEPPE